MKSRLTRSLWKIFLIALASLATLAILATLVSPASSMPHELWIVVPDTIESITTVHIYADGVRHISLPLPFVPVVCGFYLLNVPIPYGADITAELSNSYGTSPISNTQVYDGCYWDRNGDGVVGGRDFSAFLEALRRGDASVEEYSSFVSAWGLSGCISTPPQ